MLVIPRDGPLTQAFAAASSAPTRASATSTQSPSPDPLTLLFAGSSSASGSGSVFPSTNNRSGCVLLPVKNAKATEPLRPNYASQNLALASRSLRCLLSPTSAEAPTVSLEQLYGIVESLVLVANVGADLYERLKMEGERAAVEVSRLLKNEMAKEKHEWLQLLESQWKAWLTRGAIVKGVLSTLDSGYVFARPELQPSIELLLDLFKHHVLEDDQINDKAIACVVATLNEERSQSSSSGDQRQYENILSLFIRLRAYQELEAALLTATKDFYATEAARASTADAAGNATQPNATAEAATLEQYLNHAQKRIDEETKRSGHLLHSEQGKKALIDITREELITRKAEWLTVGLPALLQEEKPPLNALSLLFKHLSAVSLIVPLTVIFYDHILKVGNEIVTPPSAKDAAKVKKPPQTDEDKETLRIALADEERMIERLLDFKAKVDATVDGAFGGHEQFRQKRKGGFEKIVNSRSGGGKVAELCAKYLDAKLKSGNRTMTDQELEHCLDEALALFRYTHAKDMFEEFYKRHFAKRLLLNRSASSDAEQSMLLKLKDECGPAFTQRLETMLKDIAISEDIMKGFSVGQERARAEGDGDPFELTVNVLTQAHWPTYPTIEVRISPAMAAATERFRAYYSSRNSGRRLHWAHSLGTCTLRANFPKCGEKELHVSEFQAIILLLFNDLAPGERLSYTAIQEQTALDEAELKRTLQSLACGQIPTRVLRKDPQGREVNDTDTFGFNEGFKNERHRVRINQIQMRETVEEQESTETRVLLDRELVLQAAAVRILKARKQLKHTELLQDVVDAIKGRFQVDVAEIKKTFEILIDKEYMERVEGERGVYRYLA